MFQLDRVLRIGLSLLPRLPQPMPYRTACVARRPGRGLIVLGLLGAAIETMSACGVSAAAGGAGELDAGATPALDGGSSALDGGASAFDGGDNGADGGTGSEGPVGLILVTQVSGRSSVTVGIQAVFVPSSVMLPASCTVTRLAGCEAISCPDGALGQTQRSLDAGAITVTGTDLSSPATLTFGPGPGQGGNGYSPFSAQTRFYDSGGTVSVSGAGGADLPSFATQTLVAPNDIVLTAPVCASPLDGGACDDVDRATDVTLSWTGGGAGMVNVSYITNTDLGTKTLSCSFDALGGTGTVPSAALMMLDPGSAPGFQGQEFISPSSTKSFTVGTLTVEFAAQGTLTTGSFNTKD